MRRKFLVILSCLLVSSCAQARIDEGRRLWQQDESKCLADNGGALTKKVAVQVCNCNDKALIARMQEAGYRYMPLLYSMHVKNLKAAMYYSEGKINFQEYLDRKNLITAEAAADEQTMMATNRQQALNALAASRPAAPQPYMMPTQNTVNCTTYGNSITCR